MKIDKEDMKIRIIQIVIVAGLFYILIFYILKAAGIINTPLWLEISPQIVGVMTLLAFIFGFFDFFARLKGLPNSFETLSRRFDRMAIGLVKVEKDVEFMKKDMETMKLEIRTVKVDTGTLRKDIDGIRFDVKHLMNRRNFKAG